MQFTGFSGKEDARKILVAFALGAGGQLVIQLSGIDAAHATFDKALIVSLCTGALVAGLRAVIAMFEAPSVSAQHVEKLKTSAPPEEFQKVLEAKGKE